MIRETAKVDTSMRNPYHRYVKLILIEVIIFTILGLVIAYVADDTLDQLLGLGVVAVAMGVYILHKKFFTKFARDWDKKTGNDKQI